MFENKNLTYLEGLEFAEWVGMLAYIIAILAFGWLYSNSKTSTSPIYQYYFRGLVFKLLGAIGFCLVYIYYYRGGDTIAYYESARAYVNLFAERPFDFLKVFFGENSIENYHLFDSNTGYPWYYMYADTKTLFIIKFITPFVFLAYKSYLLSSIFLSLVSFFVLWSFFKFISKIYSGIERESFLVIFLVPSALFWGSGILKDTLTLMFSLLYIVSFYRVFIQRENSFFWVFVLVLSILVIFSVKPYILMALAPGSFIWINFERLKRVSNRTIKFFLLTSFIGVFIVGFVGLSSLGYLPVESLLSEAAEKQRDLQSDYYQGSRFNIGNYDPSIIGALSVAPSALVAALFRPFIFESRNPMMLVSGIENLIFLLSFLYIFFKIGLTKAIRVIGTDPILIFFLVYVVLLGLIVGLSTSNFGALVRFKIAYIIEWALLLLIVISESKRSEFK